LRYVAGLAEAVRRAGGTIVGGHVVRIEGTPVVVETTSGNAVTADAVVVATNTPINDRITMHTKQAPYRTYVIAAPLPRGSVPPGLYWDTADPYHYLRLQPHDDARDLLIVGGEDHHTGQGDASRAPFERLEAWAHARFEALGPVMHRWSGQIMASIDGLGFIGRNPGDAGNVFIATGDTGNGLTNGTIAGLLLADLIAGRSNPWTEVYEPARITPRAAWTFAKESLHVAAGYARWLTPARTQAHAELAPGHGAVLQRGLRKVAVYRDERGGLHELSAVCPHLGGIVVWNDVEKSWDCPCHGSRFDTNGCVLNGPAASGLDPA
jgi:glycine/D-amino acid oxidase-like deaminating enzyme/nitrite reductase/ring-hydroxylating ferredoxin subunit